MKGTHRGNEVHCELGNLENAQHSHQRMGRVVSGWAGGKGKNRQEFLAEKAGTGEVWDLVKHVVFACTCPLGLPGEI